jgi:hypothetical protein
MVLRLLVLVTLSLSLIVPAAAQTTAAPQPPPSGDIVVKGQIPDADKSVCKMTGATGSIIPKRECRTKGDWENIRARSIANLERMKAERESDRHTKANLENN